MSQNPSESELPPEVLPSGPPWRVLVVVGTARRLSQVRTQVAALRADALVETADTVVDALLRSMRKPAELMVLDLAVDDAFAPVVVRHLARVAPITTVLIFDDHARAVPAHPAVRAWDELEATLQQWWQDRRPAAPNASAVPGEPT